MADSVLWSPDALQCAVIEKRYQLVIDTRRAGNGEIKAECNGPNKPALCRFTEDSKDAIYVLELIPKELGVHQLAVKFDDSHIPRSPHVFQVHKYNPDVKNIVVTGKGIQHGVLKTFDSTFVCDLTCGGQGSLNVRIGGPKGSFKVRMERHGRKVTCKYNPHSPGEYRIHVLWSEVHVPGSPFSVYLFQKQKELDKFLENNKKIETDAP